jgi:hypothetical protein
VSRGPEASAFSQPTGYAGAVERKLLSCASWQVGRQDWSQNGGWFCDVRGTARREPRPTSVRLDCLTWGRGWNAQFLHWLVAGGFRDGVAGRTGGVGCGVGGKWRRGRGCFVFQRFVDGKANIEERIANLLYSLYLIDPVAYPARDCNPTRRTQVMFRDWNASS